ncbi:MAG: hypothetical protein HY902_20820 [Deltaproteobacteria bacterium]|nr:hypothetical protein [Deltaproteobacteria bacterium]
MSTASARNFGWWIGLVVPGGAQWRKRAWFDGALVAASVALLVILAGADASASQPPAQVSGFWLDAWRVIASGRSGPQPLWTLSLAATLQVGAAWLGRGPLPSRQLQ